MLDPYFSPLMAKDLTHLPKAYVLVSEQDVLRDDGLLYADRLKKAGNDVTLSHHKNAMHGMVISLDFPESIVINDKMLAFIKSNL